MFLNNIICFKNFTILPEFFFSICIIILLLYCVLLTTKNPYLLIQESILKLSQLIVFFTLLLLINDKTTIINITSFNNTITSDCLSYLSKIFILLFSLYWIINIKQYLQNYKINNFEYNILFLFAILGVLLLCSSNDLITAYLSIELQSLSFYVMSSFKKNSNFSVDAGLKYFILGSFSSGLFLFGSSLLYGFTGSTNFEDFKDLFFWFVSDNDILTETLDQYLLTKNLDQVQAALLFKLLLTENTALEEIHTVINYEDNMSSNSKITFDDFVLLVEFKKLLNLTDFQDFFLLEKESNLIFLQFSILFILISLFFKLAISPFHVWLPDVYEGSPTSSTFFFAVLPKLSVFILLIRLFYYSFFGFFDYWQFIIIVLALFSIIIGSFTAIAQRKLKTLFAFSSIGHMGYVLIAYTTGTFEGINILLLYLLIYMLAGSFIWSVFILLRLKQNYTYKSNKELSEFSLLFKVNKILAFIISFVLFSLAGFPPLIGFLTKASIFFVAIKSYIYYISTIALLCSVISTFYYIRIIKVIFFENKLVGNLYYPIQNQKSFLLIFNFYLFIFFFINPNLLYLLTYKISLILSLS